jgi:hypothetical protein
MTVRGEIGVRRQGAQRQAGGEAGRDSAEAAGERGRNGCGVALDNIGCQEQLRQDDEKSLYGFVRG